MRDMAVTNTDSKTLRELTSSLGGRGPGTADKPMSPACRGPSLSHSGS